MIYLSEENEENDPEGPEGFKWEKFMNHWTDFLKGDCEATLLIDGSISICEENS